MKNLRLKLAAWLAGATVHTFEGRDRKGTWHLGKIIATPEAMEAFKASFRHDASVYTDTALTDRDPGNPVGSRRHGVTEWMDADMWTQEKADRMRAWKGGPPIGEQGGSGNGN